MPTKAKNGIFFPGWGLRGIQCWSTLIEKLSLLTTGSSALIQHCSLSKKLWKLLIQLWLVLKKKQTFIAKNQCCFSIDFLLWNSTEQCWIFSLSECHFFELFRSTSNSDFVPTLAKWTNNGISIRHSSYGPKYDWTQIFILVKTVKVT